MTNRFTRTGAMLIVSALMVPSLAACGTGSLGGTPTQVAGANLCTTYVPVKAIVEPVPTFEGEVPSATATPLPTGSIANAPAYAEIDAKLEALRKILAGMKSPDDYMQHQAEIDAANAEIAKAWAAIEHTKITGWQAWVVATGSDAVQIGSEMGLVMPSDTPSINQMVLLGLFDPYTLNSAPVPEAKARGIMGRNFSAPEPFMLVAKPTVAEGKTLCLGQKVTVDGVAEKSYYNTNDLGVYINEGRIVVAEDKLLDKAAYQGLEGVAVRFERGMCFGFCPAYRVTVYGNGVVVFHGRANTKALGYRIAQVDQATVQKLVDTLSSANFDTMPSYTNYEITDMASVQITQVKSGKTHTVNHYLGDSKAPESLTTLETAIDEILNTGQWIQ